MSSMSSDPKIMTIENLDFPPRTASFPSSWAKLDEVKAGADSKGWNIRVHDTPINTVYLSTDLYEEFAADLPDHEHRPYSELN